MIITYSGYDGVGKSTNVDKLVESIADKYQLRGTSIYDVNNGTELYETEEDLDHLYEILSQYDVVGTRFYLRSPIMQELQDKVMFTSTQVFENTVLIKEVAEKAAEEAELWYKKVIKKLLDQNKIIVYDRYFFDELSYRALYGLDPDYIENLYTNYIKPDLSLFLSANMNTIKERNKSRIDMKTALFNSKEKMDELYERLHTNCKKFNMQVLEIDGKCVEEVKQEIFEIVDQYLQKYNKIEALKGCK